MAWTRCRIRALDLGLGVLVGLSAIVGTGFRIVALRTVDGTVLFPLTTVAVILIAQAAGRVIWKERVPHAGMGLALGLAAAVLLTLGG